MQESREPGGSATRWAHSSADAPATGPRPGKVLGLGNTGLRACARSGKIGSGSRVLDCGCGAGRFARMPRIVARASPASTLPRSSSSSPPSARRRATSGLAT